MSITGELSMPLTAGDPLARGRGDREAVAHGQAVLVGPALVDDRAVAAQRARHARSPRAHSKSSTRPTVAGSTTLTPSSSPKASAPSCRTPRPSGRPAPAIAALDGGVDRRPAVLVDDDVRRGQAVLEGAAGRVLEALAEDAHGRHERDADGQRQRGDQRAAGVAHRVAAGQPAGRAADRLRGTAEEARRWRGRRDRRARLGPSAATHAQGCDRRDPRRPPGGDEARQHGDDRADQQRRRRPSAWRTPCRVGQVDAHADEHGVEALGQPEAGGEADERRPAAPMTSASTSTEPSTWRRPAPTIRSSPSSRVRWATVIESVLKIVNAPTRIATPPKTSSAIPDDRR